MAVWGGEGAGELQEGADDGPEPVAQVGREHGQAEVGGGKGGRVHGVVALARAVQVDVVDALGGVVVDDVVEVEVAVQEHGHGRGKPGFGGVGRGEQLGQGGDGQAAEVLALRGEAGMEPQHVVEAGAHLRHEARGHGRAGQGLLPDVAHGLGDEEAGVFHDLPVRGQDHFLEIAAAEVLEEHGGRVAVGLEGLDRRRQARAELFPTLDVLLLLGQLFGVAFLEQHALGARAVVLHPADAAARARAPDGAEVPGRKRNVLAALPERIL
ncbi:hypothetical protein DSECCO2_512870 [anaerobic digester metagenome]